MTDSPNIIPFPLKIDHGLPLEQGPTEIIKISDGIQGMLHATHQLAKAVVGAKLTPDTHQQFLTEIKAITRDTAALYLLLAQQFEGAGPLVARIQSVLADLRRDPP
ncbi:hypothetical protein [Phreatobacter oligotrophus]|jgi:hypothetical protein|uniref:Uncharacterized protein n=1 Tax=Phreatobacter oligotrophus TaxID=1122261 RepID=A0A2T4YX02_9HYPH|nr:hypothetical protein [Phreatobacter oligotrophus]PTM49899.1 hypothetical protein C8P69_11613 [Phreatobacter oligotrophus]